MSDNQEDNKFKKYFDLAVRIVLAGILIYFVYNIIVTQHNYFS